MNLVNSVPISVFNPVPSWVCKRLSITFVLLSLSACSSFDTQYHDTNSLTPLQFPAQTNSDAFVELYRVPEAERAGVLFDRTPLPPAAGLRSDVTAVAFKLEDTHWLRTNLPPSTTWSQLLNFWREQGIDLASQDLSSATMKTGWFSKAIQPGYEIRYALKLERGLQFQSSEVIVYNQSRRSGEALSEAKLESVTNENHAQFMLNEMQAYLNGQPDPATDSFLASTLSLPARVTYLDSPEEPELSLLISNERFFSSVEQAVSKGDLHLFEASTDAGILYIEQYDADKKLGFFDRFNPASKVGKTPETNYSLEQVLNQLDLSDEQVASVFAQRFSVSEQPSIGKAPGYLLALYEREDGAKRIKVRDTRGQPLERKEAQQLLELIRRQLL